MTARERAERRRASRSSSKTGWILFASFLGVVVVGYGAWASGLVMRIVGHETDIAAVAEDFAADWAAGNVGAMVKHHHPDGSKEFRAMLESIAAGRGWSSGFPPTTEVAARVTKHDDEGEPSRGLAMMQYGEDDQATIHWQFSPARKRWYIYDLALTPPRLAPRAQAFRMAWQESDPALLEPFFRPGKERDMSELVAKRATESGWAASHPALGEPIISGERNARGPLARVLAAGPVESSFKTERGELVARWVFRDSEDQWYISGFRFPK